MRSFKRGQLSLEFSILLLAMLVAIIISSLIPGMYGYKESITVSQATLAHAAMSKLKNNIDILTTSDEGSIITLMIKSPKGGWRIDNRNITFYGDGYNITTTCNIDLDTNNITYNTSMRGITIRLIRYSDKVYINWTN